MVSPSAPPTPPHSPSPAIPLQQSPPHTGRQPTPLLSSAQNMFPIFQPDKTDLNIFCLNTINWAGTLNSTKLTPFFNTGIGEQDPNISTTNSSAGNLWIYGYIHLQKNAQV